jgi:predicted GNAT family acetyltransferase
MTTSADDVEVVDVPAESRFVVRDNGAEAELVYHRHGDRLVLIHTEVPDEMSRRGIGGHLVRAAVRRAESDGVTIVPWCPFARRWLKEHRDAVAGVTIDWDAQPPGSE